MSSVAFYSLGCKVNQYEVIAMSELFASYGYDVLSFNDVCDVYIVNTCTVTNLSDKKSRQAIRRAKSQNPNAIVCAVGCYAQISHDDISNIEGINIIVGSKNKSRIVSYVENYNISDGVVCLVDELCDDDAFERLSVKSFEGRVRAFMKIQDGCRQFCSYCIIPYTRGTIRSRNLNDILTEATSFAENGFKEIVLTGIHVASYGRDLNSVDLLDVIKLVHDIPGIERIRLSSIEPLTIDERFVSELSQLHKICNHFHLSLQSGCDSILKSMNRHYSTEQYAYAVKLLRDAFTDVALWTDVIVGFPGESDAFFNESYDFISSLRLTKLHVFQYSPKKGTPAASFNMQVEPALKQERSKKMIALSNQLYSEFLDSNLGKVTDVLYEHGFENSSYEGHTSNYIKVITKCDFDIVNNFSKTLLDINEQSYIKGFLMFA